MIDDLIFDVGMHVGEDTAYYLHRGFRVVAIEANPLLAEAGREKFQQAIARGRLQILNVGIAAEEGSATFWVNDARSQWSSFSKEAGCREGTPCHPVEVQCVRFGTLLSEHGVPHYLKVDIEGNDPLCIEALEPTDLPRYVSIEAHTPDYLRMLHDLGYDAFKCINQGNHNDDLSHVRAYVSSAARLRRFFRRLTHKLGAPHRTRLDWHFPAGSSGPFGDDTAGSWRSYEDARAIFEQHLAGDGPLNPRYWYDFHATKRR